MQVRQSNCLARHHENPLASMRKKKTNKRARVGDDEDDVCMEVDEEEPDLEDD